MAEMNKYISEGIDVSSLNVLIVDDVPLNVLLIKKMLTQYSFQIRTASNGQLAVDAVMQQKPDLILLDLLMPVMDGFGVIETLRGNESYKDIPIIVLSALNSAEDVSRAFKLGANDFINKPVIMEKLISSVTQQINLRHAMQQMNG